MVSFFLRRCPLCYTINQDGEMGLVKVCGYAFCAKFVKMYISLKYYIFSLNMWLIWLVCFDMKVVNPGFIRILWIYLFSKFHWGHVCISNMYYVQMA